MAKKRREKTEEDYTFTVDYLDKEEKPQSVVCEIKKPTIEQINEAGKVFNTAFNSAVKSKAMLRARLSDFIREQGLWNDEKEQELQALKRDIRDKEKILESDTKLSLAQKAAVDIRRLRAQLRQLLSVQNEYDRMTADGQADDERFNYLVSVTTVYHNTGEPVWKDVSDYLNPSIPEIALRATSKYASLLYGVDEDFEFTLPENRFLSEFGFVDEALRLVNKEGELVDTENRLIDEFGNYIAPDGSRVDIEGNPVDDAGMPIITFGKFTDDDGNVVSPKADSPTEEVNEEEPEAPPETE